MVYVTGAKHHVLAALAALVGSCVICTAQEKTPEASKAYISELKAMFQRMEMVEVEKPPGQMDAGDLKLPSFKLRNKGGAPISAPRYRADGFSDFSKPAPLGFPYWKFTPVPPQGPKPPSIVYFKGMNFVPSVPLEPGSALGVSSGGQIFAVGGKLMPGKYRLSVEFRAYYPFGFVHAPGPLPTIGLSHPNDFLVTIGTSGLARDDQKSNRNAAPPVSPKKAGASAREEWLARNDKTNLGKSPLMDAIALEKLELSADVVKVGAPVSYTYTLSVKPGCSIPELAAGNASALKFTCTVYRLISSSKRERIHGGMMVVEPAAFRQLCGSKAAVASNYLPEYIKLEPGSYELELCFWDDAISFVPGTANTKYVLLKVVK